jgi:hypothetical protein
LSCGFFSPSLPAQYSNGPEVTNVKRLISGLLLPSLLLCSASAMAQQSGSPANFVYTIKTGMGGPSTLDISLAVTVTSTSRDGTRNANIAVHMPHMPLDGKNVDATISPAGAITIASTGQFDTKGGYSAQSIQANEAAATAPMLQNMIAPLNTFASGCGKAPSQKTGASWHSLDETRNDMIYTISGREQRGGRDTLAITMKSATGASATASGQGNYDPVAHLVVSLHSETHQMQAMQIVDVALTNP